MRVLGSRPAIAIVMFVTGATVAAGVAYAAIPDSTAGTITACYPTSGASKGALRVIDAQVGAHCGAGQAMLNWPSSSFRWRGGWTGTAAYRVNDVVRYVGSAYIAVKPNTNVAPTSTASWALMASAGASGVGGSCNGFPHEGVDWSLPGSAPGRGCDFTGANLTFANISNANMTNANFTGAAFNEMTMTGANITGANLNADFSSEDVSVVTGGLIGTPAALGPDWILRAGWLVGPRSDLTGANLAGANMAGADLFVTFTSGANLSGANLTKASLFGMIADKAPVNLSHANLAGANLGEATLPGANLSGANLTGADASDANLDGANLTGAIVTKVTWDNTTCPDGSNSVYSNNTCAGHLTAKK